MPTPRQSETTRDAAILLFDGMCNFCNGSVMFFLRHERAPVARFGSLQSPAARTLLLQHRLDPEAVDTVVLIENGAAYQRSTAVLRASRLLRRPWSFLAALLWIPRPGRDLIYRGIARSRYRLFGKRDACMLPSPELRARFLDVPPTHP